MSSCNLQSLKAGLYYVAIKNRDAMADTVSTIQQHSSLHALSEKGHKCLNTILDSINLELFEHHLHHPNFVADWVHNGFSQEHRRSFRVIDPDLNTYDRCYLTDSKEYFNRIYMSSQFFTIPSDVG